MSEKYIEKELNEAWDPKEIAKQDAEFAWETGHPMDPAEWENDDKKNIMTEYDFTEEQAEAYNTFYWDYYYICMAGDPYNDDDDLDENLTETKATGARGRYQVEVFDEGDWHKLNCWSTIEKATKAGEAAVEAVYQDYRIIDKETNNEVELQEKLHKPTIDTLTDDLRELAKKADAEITRSGIECMVAAKDGYVIAIQAVDPTKMKQVDEIVTKVAEDFDFVPDIERKEKPNGTVHLYRFKKVQKLAIKENIIEEESDGDIPYTKEEVEAELKRETNNWETKEDTIRYGFQSEKDFAMEILSQHYECEYKGKEGSDYVIHFWKEDLTETFDDEDDIWNEEEYLEEEKDWFRVYVNFEDDCLSVEDISDWLPEDLRPGDFDNEEAAIEATDRIKDFIKNNPENEHFKDAINVHVVKIWTREDEEMESEVVYEVDINDSLEEHFAVDTHDQLDEEDIKPVEEIEPNKKQSIEESLKEGIFDKKRISVFNKHSGEGPYFITLDPKKEQEFIDKVKSINPANYEVCEYTEKNGKAVKGKPVDKYNKIMLDYQAEVKDKLDAINKEKENKAKEEIKKQPHFSIDPKTGAKKYRDLVDEEDAIDAQINEDAADIEKPKYEVGSEKVFAEDSEEHAQLQKAADKLTDLSVKNYKYFVGNTYLDFGSGWQWTTILAKKPNEVEFQVLSPLSWRNILNAQSEEELDAAIDQLRSDEYFHDKIETPNTNSSERDIFNYLDSIED